MNAKDDIIRCQECLRPNSQPHYWRCSRASLEEKAAGAEREIEQYWMGQVERLKAHAARSHALIASFHGRYAIVKHENNALRRRLYRK
jgi:hypothetical protein